MRTHEEIYTKLHEGRHEFIEEKRRARDYQARAAELEAHVLKLAEINAEILALIVDKAARHSEASQCRVVLGMLALEIAEIMA